MSHIEYATVKLVSFMNHKQHHKRCTSEDALNYCHQISSNLENLDRDFIDKMVKTIFSRENLSVEDVCRGKTNIM